MRFKYSLPFKTRLMLWMISPFRQQSDGPPTMRQIKIARKTVPRFFLSTWVLGRMAPLQSVEDKMIPVRDAEIKVRIYRPLGEAAVRPLVVNYHGGGWVVGNLQINDYYCSVLANRVGAVVVSVDYRLAPENKFPTAIHDAYDALKWAVAQASTLGIDPARVCVTGDSAGGNLAAAVCLKARELGGPSIKEQVLVYPATDSSLDYPSMDRHAHAPILTKENVLHFLEFYMGEPAHRQEVLLSPYLADSLSGLPHAIVVTAGYDPLCDDGQNYADRLNAEGAGAEVLHYPNDLHGFFSFPNHSLSGKKAIEEVALRLKERL